MKKASGQGVRRGARLMIAAAAFAALAASAGPAVAATTPAAASAAAASAAAAAARPNVLSESARTAASPQVTNTLCYFTVVEEKSWSPYANTVCGFPVRSIVYNAFGEDKYGNVTWDKPYSCYNTTRCYELWIGSSLDTVQTVCVEVTFYTGTPEIIGDCKSIKAAR